MLPVAPFARRLISTRTLAGTAVVLAITALAGPARALAAVQAASLAAAPGQEWASQAYLPLAGTGMLPRHLAAPRTAVPAAPTTGPSATPRATAFPTDTPTASPTHTPHPTATPTAKPLDVEETDPALTYAGTWRRVADARASGGAYNSSSGNGDSVTVTFAGDHIVLYRLMAPDGGYASVAIDGQVAPYGNLTFYFNERRYQVPAVFDNLSAGTHTLKLTVSDRKPTGSSGTNVYVDAVRAPDRLTSNDLQREALDYANGIRSLVGLPRIRLDRGINLAAQSHAEYAARNTNAGHNETPGTAGFIGTRFNERMAYFGYNAYSGEVISWATNNSPTAAIDIWIGSVYHRLPFLDHASTDIGYGQAKGAQFTTAVVDIGRRDHVPPGERLIVTYPDDGQTGVPVSWRHNTEGPDPLPGQPAEVGYPLSLHIAQPAGGHAATVPWVWDGLVPEPRTFGPSAWQLGSAKLTDPSGRDVPAYVLDQANDSPKYLPADTVYVMARTKMLANSRYSLRITGQDSRDQAFDVSWSFTTGRGD